MLTVTLAMARRSTLYFPVINTKRGTWTRSFFKNIKGRGTFNPKCIAGNALGDLYDFRVLSH